MPSSLADIGGHVKAGDYAPALAAAKASVMGDPGDPGARIALCTLLAAGGERDRALNQWRLALDLGCGPQFAHFGAMIEAEERRDRVFRGEEPPSLPEGCVADWVGDWSDALGALHAGDPQPLAALVEAADVGLSEIEGSNGEVDFEGFRCLDSRMRGFVEGVFDGEYRWIPFEWLLRLRLPEAPELLGDFLWLPVSVHPREGLPLVGHLYATAPGTAADGSPAERLGRGNGWDETFGELDLCRGVQLFGLGSEVLPVFRLGDCRFGGGGAARSGS